MKPKPRTLIAALLAALVAGCGPGSGGTGTGETGSAFARFGATAASICASSLAPALACIAGSSSAPINPEQQVSTMVNFSDVAFGGNISVAIQANSIELSERCRKLHFLGDWGITASNDARFFGSYTQDNLGAVIASLSVQPAASGAPNELSVVMRDADGRVVLGPVTLQRVTLPVVPTAVCP